MDWFSLVRILWDQSVHSCSEVCFLAMCFDGDEGMDGDLGWDKRVRDPLDTQPDECIHR